MTTTGVAKGRPADLPQALATAQAAMLLPEVQEMLRRLSEYELGIFMPHMHDAQTSDFQALAADLIQVEPGLEVSFRSLQQIQAQGDRFLPVGWAWRDGAPTVAACEMDGQDKPGGAVRYVKHKMVRAN